MQTLDLVDFAIVQALRHLDPPELAELLDQVLPLAGGEDERAAFLQRVEQLRRYVAAVPVERW